MRTKLFIISVLTLGLVTMGAMVSFAATDNATISATVGAARNVAMGDLAFGSLSVGYTKAASDLTFNSNYASNVLRIWTANSPAARGMVSGVNTIPLKYWFDKDGGTSPDPSVGTNWTDKWTAVGDTTSGDSKNELYTGGPIDKSTAGDGTLDFATLIDLTTQEGSYSTLLQLEIVSP